MKIYNRKNFFIGLLLALYAVVMFLYGLRRGFPPLQLGLPVMWLAMAGGWIFRGLSKKQAKRDILEERDERNRHINLKASQRALQITQAACLAGGAALYLHSDGGDRLFWIGSGLFAALMLSLFAELGASIWYERRL
nr:DUF2178 domain-containing protein [uncultured Oscillibacter sp.]